jgi:hypothetical protein
MCPIVLQGGCAVTHHSKAREEEKARKYGGKNTSNENIGTLICIGCGTNAGGCWRISCK